MNKRLQEIFLLEIKSKNQIKDLENKYILDKLNKFFLTNGNIRKNIEKEFEEKGDKIIKSKKFKEILKSIRQEIGQIYGQFLTKDFNKREKLLEKKDIESLLKLHKSTRERINYYEEIYSKIFEWYKPQKIGDLACGLNPISFKIMKIKPKYFASDLNPSDMVFLNKFFEKENIDGNSKAYDITTLEILKDEEFQSCDLIFLFKALDSFEEVKKGISKQLLEKIKAKKIVVSFPTKSLISKVDFKNTNKGWLRKIIDENNWKYDTFEIENEIFFLISKN